MITILIQGPLRNALYYEYLPRYLSYGKVVLCCYIEDNTSYIEETYPEVQIVKIPIPATKNIFNFNNTFLQTNGILEGLKQIDTEFTIRVRADESFPNLDTFIKNMLEHPNKMQVTNLYSFKDVELKFCVGNHLFGGKTSILKTAFEWAYDVCVGKNPNATLHQESITYRDVNGVGIPMWSEILQTVSFIHALGVPIDASRSREIMIENFFMTPLQDLPDFKWTHKFNSYAAITADTQMEYTPDWSDNRFLKKIEDI